MDNLNVAITQKEGIIDFSSFEELKVQLAIYLEEYRYASFTEESKGFAKTAVADLRKLKKTVNDKKIEVKKAYMLPLEEFETKTKELLAMIDEPIGLIDGQIKSFEEKRIKMRLEEIEIIYDELVGDLASYASLSKIYSSKWENASISIKKVKEEIEQQILNVRMDIESLKLMRVAPDVIEYALRQYKEGCSAVDAMKKANQFAELLEQREKIEEPLNEGMQIQTAGFENDNSFDMPFETPSSRKAVYHIITSAEKLELLEAYMNSLSVNYERMN